MIGVDGRELVHIVDLVRRMLGGMGVGVGVWMLALVCGRGRGAWVRGVAGARGCG